MTQPAHVSSELVLPATHTGGLLRSTDWSSTPLGPMEGWPQSLRIAVGICLNSRFPMFVWWGSELINIYNDAYIPVLGKRHPAAFGRSAPDIWGEIWPVVGPQAEAVMRRGEATWNERVLLVMERHGYTEDTWFTWSYSPIPDERGGIGGVFCACTEDTPRVLVERERDALLEEVELERRRLEEAFRQSPAFLAMLRGPELVFDFVNDRYLQLIGQRPVIGKPVRAALPEIEGQGFEGQGFFEILDRVYASGEPFVGTGIRMILRRDAARAPEETYLDFVYQPMRAHDGSVSGILVHGVEVTEQKRAERTLRESEARFRQLADAMPQIVFTALPDGRIDYFNQQWYEYTGLPQGAIGYESWQAVLTEEGLRHALSRWSEAVRSGGQYEAEYSLRRRDGEYRWHLGRAVPIRDEQGRVVRWFGTNTDIHERKQFEQSLQDARAEAERASRMKDEFLATLSHELRTPLNAILGWSGILRHAPELPADLAQGVEVIERNARAQGRIIDDLLDMSAIISGKVRLDLRRIDLAEVVRAALETAAPAAAAKQVHLHARLGPPAGAPVSGDASRLQQVLWNLLSNAVKFTPAGGRIEVSLEESASHFRIRVSDTGEGIKPEFLPFIFDRFRQADASKTRRYGGLGLGLSIVKQLVEIHGGSVRVHSAGPGLGATFSVQLPRALAPALPALPPDRDGDIAGLRILVVDDDEDARDVVQRLLGEYKAAVTTAGSAAEAARQLEQRRFDVLVSDIGMPGEDGHALLRRVRAMGRERGGDIPAIALSAYARPEDRVQALRAGFQTHVAKPVEPAELIATIASIARRP